MKPTIIALFILVFSKNIAFSQESFTLKIQEVPEKIERSKTQKIIYALSLESKDMESELFKDYTVSVKPDCNTGTLSQTEFILDFKDCTLDELSDGGYPFYLTILPNPNLDKERTIKLDISITSSKDPKLEKIKNNADETSQIIMLKPIELDTALDQYNYLAYVGTNFDLVDGVKAKNLFFATNIYQLPILNDNGRQSGIGFNFTIYGNRTLTITEDYGQRTYPYKYEELPDKEGITRVFNSRADLTKSYVSDNLGAAFSPMFNINIPKFRWKNLADQSRTLQIIYAPQFEFVWRRYSETTSYSNITAVDTVDKELAWRGTGTYFLNSESETLYDNIYDFNLGLLGLFVSHQSEDLSVRFQFTGGISRRFKRERTSGSAVVTYSDFKATGNLFFGARIWITEPISGITLGAEMSNRVFKNYEPIYNVTLSKALNFNSIGSIFSPITAR